MIPVVGSIITALAVSVFIFPILIKYSQKKKFLTSPGTDEYTNALHLQ
jgi:hypothetical protein